MTSTNRPNLFFDERARARRARRDSDSSTSTSDDDGGGGEREGFAASLARSLLNQAAAADTYTVEGDDLTGGEGGSDSDLSGDERERGGGGGGGGGDGGDDDDDDERAGLLGVPSRRARKTSRKTSRPKKQQQQQRDDGDYDDAQSDYSMDARRSSVLFAAGDSPLPPGYGDDDSDAKYGALRDDEDAEREEPPVPNAKVPKRSAGLGSSTFNMANAAVGAGMLSFPWGYSQAGITLGVLISLFVMGMGTYTMRVLAKCGLRGHCVSYQHVVHTYLGYRFGKFIEYFLVVSLTGSCVAYLTALGDVVVPVVQHFTDGHSYAIVGNRKLCMAIFATLTCFPLTLFKRIQVLGFTSLLAIAAAVYTVGFIIADSLLFVARDPDFAASEARVHFAPQWHVRALAAMPIIVYGFNCHLLVVPVAAELKRPTQKRMDTVIFAAVFTCFMLYSLTGILGYLRFGKVDVKNDVLLGYSITYIPAAVARVTVGITCCFSYPVVFFAARLAIKSIVLPQRELTTRPFAAITVCFYAVTLLIAMFVPKISLVFGLMGATAATTCMLVVPSLLSYKVLGAEEREARVMGVIGLLVAAFIGVSGTAITIYVNFFADADEY